MRLLGEAWNSERFVSRPWYSALFEGERMELTVVSTDAAALCSAQLAERIEAADPKIDGWIVIETCVEPSRDTRTLIVRALVLRDALA